MTPHPDDTIVALSSAPGPGRRAIVRVTGPKTREVVAKVFLPSPLGGEGPGWGVERTGRAIPRREPTPTLTLPPRGEGTRE